MFIAVVPFIPIALLLGVTFVPLVLSGKKKTPSDNSNDLPPPSDDCWADIEAQAKNDKWTDVTEEEIVDFQNRERKGELPEEETLNRNKVVLSAARKLYSTLKSLNLRYVYFVPVMGEDWSLTNLYTLKKYQDGKKRLLDLFERAKKAKSSLVFVAYVTVKPKGIANLSLDNLGTFTFYVSDIRDVKGKKYVFGTKNKIVFEETNPATGMKIRDCQGEIRFAFSDIEQMHIWGKSENDFKVLGSVEPWGLPEMLELP